MPKSPNHEREKEAIEYACSLLQDPLYSPTNALSHHLRLIMSDAGELQTDDGDPVDYLTGERASLFIPLAYEDPIIYKALCELSAELLERDNQLPPDLNRFAVQVLRGKKPPRKKSGVNPEITFYRKAIIANAVICVCQRYGYEPTRFHLSDNVSGCDIVSKAQISLRRSSPSSYPAIKKIFHDLIKRHQHHPL